MRQQRNGADAAGYFGRAVAVVSAINRRVAEADAETAVVADGRAVANAEALGGDAARVLAEVMERDARDAGREASPMVVAAGALVLDTSEMTVAEAVARAIGAVEARISA